MTLNQCNCCSSHGGQSTTPVRHMSTIGIYFVRFSMIPTLQRTTSSRVRDIDMHMRHFTASVLFLVNGESQISFRGMAVTRMVGLVRRFKLDLTRYNLIIFLHGMEYAPLFFAKASPILELLDFCKGNLGIDIVDLRGEPKEVQTVLIARAVRLLQREFALAIAEIINDAIIRKVAVGMVDYMITVRDLISLALDKWLSNLTPKHMFCLRYLERRQVGATKKCLLPCLHKTMLCRSRPNRSDD
ncbi:hypothetical protein B0H34DRAFT_215738 [Crassisporium funariophilum]|nr:hypothetical protein B0H34DRAFT_215738 [Crassisporium funariophilum]